MTNTIILKKPFSCITKKKKRWLVDGRRPDTEYVKNILIKFGVKIQDIEEEVHHPMKVYKGFKFKHLHPYIIKASNPTEHNNLWAALKDDNLVLHICEVPY